MRGSKQRAVVVARGLAGVAVAAVAAVACGTGSTGRNAPEQAAPEREAPAVVITLAAPTTTAPAGPAELPANQIAVAADSDTEVAVRPAASPVDARSSSALGLLRRYVDGRWLARVPATVSVVAGSTSWSSYSGHIEISEYHVAQGEDVLAFTVVHEWGHVVAYRLGTGDYLGAPPTGFPVRGANSYVAEAWADCVAEVLTGFHLTSHRLPPCPGDARAFTRRFLSGGGTTGTTTTTRPPPSTTTTEPDRGILDFG